MTGYTTREVAEILGLSPRQVRTYARSGFLEPARGSRNEYRFSFRDIVLLRVIRDLLSAEVRPRRIHGALAKLRDRLPAGRPLSSLRIATDGERVLVESPWGTWEVESGQMVIDFAVAELAERAVPFARRRVEETGTGPRVLDADDWYNVGVDLEAVALEEAARAYRMALEVDPDHSPANVNLGRLLHETGDVMTAREHYRRALAADPCNPVAAYNLGVALEDAGDVEGAIGLYRRAVRLDPARADAHFNLARIYEGRGERDKAFRHYLRYQALAGRERG
ncbi:MAG: tetratricopeptide repeat protein [Gemmatimonadetes bacterium]|nr:tetratricopeptide repeat protein [Gemmatimonadota bacterium]